jgi:hypothetical protein
MQALMQQQQQRLGKCIDALTISPFYVKAKNERANERDKWNFKLQ